MSALEKMIDVEVDALAAVLIATAFALVWAVLAIRVFGLRSLSKMAAFDFVVTVGLGTIVGSTAATSIPLWQGVLAFASLLALQWLVARLRQASSAVNRLTDNRPLLLMDGPELLHGNLEAARVTPDDVYGKLREANVTDLSQVLAVVLEATGDVSVLHGTGPLDDTLLSGVDTSRRGTSS